MNESINNESLPIINAFYILINKDISIKFLKYCFNKRLGFRHFNKSQIEENRLTKDEWDLLKKLILHNNNQF